ncbi:DNA cytosine methyltransferase [Arcicella lustrica]|uniref:Cytosine-specific methyltransferase n=1 Tax=Arcicella lustrica TaxID=2984196 RepID=A0ABU5SE85_9BACT|nr:DNA (cytosine-5-)-methyltransferase [Arcicella sp. DC25W]MEA5425349.1 DNA (cytosine-5-)-methyltransferase [Arcicella sp. DC25W]
MKKDISMVELFSGTGGFSVGFKNAGYNITEHYFSEKNKHAIANFKYNFHGAKFLGPVANVSARQFYKPDVLTFGSPCQDFSLLGRRAGLEGARSILIMEAIRIISESQPSVFIWENVKGAFSSNGRRDFWAILQAFANLRGYRFKWQLLNSKWILPQNRERLYLIGHLDGRSFPGVFPFTESDFRTTQRTTNSPVIRTITAGANSGGHHSSMTLIHDVSNKNNFGRNSNKQHERVYDPKGIIGTLTGNRLDDKAKIITTGRGYVEGDLKDYVGTITSSSFEQNNHLYFQNTIRRLTEIECERCQGLPDDWTRYGIYTKRGKEVTKEIAKTNRYRMIGNAVSGTMVQMIAE